MSLEIGLMLEKILHGPYVWENQEYNDEIDLLEYSLDNSNGGPSFIPHSDISNLGADNSSLGGYSNL